MQRPKNDEYGPFYQTYIQKVPKGNLLVLLNRSFKNSKAVFAAIEENHGNWAYSPEKWTIKQLLIHLIDTDRVFSHRAFAIMRGENAPLPGFLQDDYVANSLVENRSIRDLLAEWKTVHDSTIFLYKQCSEAQSKRFGKASGLAVTPRALFCMIIGHRLHHLSVLEERYAAVIGEKS